MRIKLLPLILYIIAIHVSCNLKSEDFQYKSTHGLKQLLAPIDFSPQGFATFLRDAYNQPVYGQEFLPNNFDHLVQFLEYGFNSHQPRSYEQHIIRLFTNKLKSSGYINAAIIENVLEKMPRLLASQCAEKKRPDVHRLHEMVSSLLYNSFLEKFSFFKASPTDFLVDLSHEIVHTLGVNENPYDIVPHELRGTILVFLEVTLSKLVWNPADGMQTWQSLKTIADHLAVLRDHEIIADSDDLNSLYITLLERYCFFIDIAQFDLPVSFYSEIKQDLSVNESLLLTLEDLDDLVESKRSRLSRVVADAHSQVLAVRQQELLTSQVRAKALEHGIVV